LNFRNSIAVVLASSVLLAGCARQPADYTPVYGSSPIVPNTIPQYSFGVPAIRHARSLWDRYALLIQALNRASAGFTLKMESAQTPDTYDAKLRGRVFDFAIVDPYQVLVAENLGYAVIARTGKPDRISGVIVTARQGDLHRVADLRGRSIAFTNSTALAATLLNEYGLLENGFDFRRNAVVLYTHSPETSLLSVSIKRVDAAAVSMADWEGFRHDHPASSGQLNVLWQSDDLSGPAVMASGSIPRAHVQILRAALTQLGGQPNGREALQSAGISEFEPGDSVSYDDVWDFLQRYRHSIGPLPDRMVAR
jgi:ABC-type phosphate/phosphonate transport system substrate-binding protein